MKVLQLIDTLDAGGAERMAANIANAVSENGAASYICATRRGGSLEQEIYDDVGVLLLEKKGKFDIKAFIRFFKWVKKEEIDIIHAHSTSIFLAVLAKIRNPKLKIVWHDHYGLSENLDERPTKVLSMLSTYIDTTIAVNNKLADWSTKILKIKEVYYLPNFAFLSRNTRKETVLKGLKDKRVLCLANLRSQKNHIGLIKAFAQSIESYPEWTLHLVGQSFKNDYAVKVEQCINDYKVGDKVFLYGSCNDIVNILDQTTIGVLASISEGLPVSLLEYGNNGLPVIVTNVGQCAEVVGDDGILINNVKKDLPDALVRFYKNVGNERESIGLRFRESVQKTYSKQAFMQKLLPIYKGLIS